MARVKCMKKIQSSVNRTLYIWERHFDALRGRFVVYAFNKKKKNGVL